MGRRPEKTRTSERNTQIRRTAQSLLQMLFMAGIFLWLVCLTGVQPSSAQSSAGVTKREAVTRPTAMVDFRTVDMGGAKFGLLLTDKAIGRLILPVLIDGKTAFASRQPGFSYYLDGQSGISYVRETVALAKKSGLPVYAYINLLHWEAAGKNVAPRPAVLPLLERVSDLSPGDARRYGFYASPFRDDVWASLDNFVKELSRELPEIEGVYLHLEMPSDIFYGYNPQARTASIRVTGYDPVDVATAQPGDAETMQAAIANFRLGHVKTRLQTFCESIRVANPRWNIVLVCDPDMPTQDLRSRSRSLNDWLSWLDIGGVGEIVYRTTGVTDPVAAVSRADALRQKARQDLPSGTMINGNAFRKQGATVGAGDPWQNIVFEVSSEADLYDLSAFLPSRAKSRTP